MTQSCFFSASKQKTAILSALIYLIMLILCVKLDARANTIIRKFNCASLNTKLTLFKAYCMPIYGCQLWCSMSQYAYNKLRVAYNDGFRQLLNEPKWCSASKLFVFNYVPVYAAVTRKLIYSLWCTVFKSGNVLLRGLVNSMICMCSLLFSGGDGA